MSSSEHCTCPYSYFAAFVIAQAGIAVLQVSFSRGKRCVVNKLLFAVPLLVYLLVSTAACSAVSCVITVVVGVLLVVLT